MFSAAVYWLAGGAPIHGTLRVQCEAKGGCQPRRPGLAVGMYVQTEWRESRKTRAASGPKTLPGHAIVDAFDIRENNRLVDFKRRWDLRLNCSLNFKIFAITIGGRSCRRHEFLSPTY